MHYSNPRPKFEDWLCNKVSMCSSQTDKTFLGFVIFCLFLCPNKETSKYTITSFYYKVIFVLCDFLGFS